jgi:hypothetical protein
LKSAYQWHQLRRDMGGRDFIALIDGVHHGEVGQAALDVRPYPLDGDVRVDPLLGDGVRRVTRARRRGRYRPRRR